MREAKRLSLFHFSGEGGAEEKEVELGHWHDFLEEILHRNRGAFYAQKSRCTTCIYCWYDCTEIEEYRLHLMHCTDII